ncbi:MAG: polysaccharide deacetylase family protein [Clostridia bacterium]|nr:polysaccharide deacetylase family protein [Clostridia bacterium]
MKIYIKYFICVLVIFVLLILFTPFTNYNEPNYPSKTATMFFESEVLPLNQDTTSIPIPETNFKESEIKTANKIYLTFDDGPSTNITPKILDLLAKYDIKATFFILNYNNKKKEIIKRIIEEGHTLGIHGYSHDYESIYSSPDKCLENFILLKNKIYNDFCIDCNIVRFPGGSSNTVSKKYCTGVISNSLSLLAEHTLVYFDWNISSGDAGLTTDPNEVFNYVVNFLKPKRNNMVLMHDSSSKEHTYLALENIILYAFKNNYCFEKITTDTIPVHHKIYN